MFNKSNISCGRISYWTCHKGTNVEVSYGQLRENGSWSSMTNEEILPVLCLCTLSNLARENEK